MTAKTFDHYEEKILEAPIMINLELTSGCNVKCRHCYNFWREDSANTKDKISIEQMDKLIAMVEEAKVFHVVLSGGEPMIIMDTLVYAISELSKRGISTSVNSNLMLTTPEKMKRLKDAGLDHILTSLNSYKDEVNDYMVHRKGALVKIVEGIKNAVAADIRVSANMIISDPNKDDVYGTAKLASELGVQKIFATRLVPSVRVEAPSETDLKLDRESARGALDELLRAKEDFGIAIGTLISYPLCMLEDLEKYKDFVGRGCPAHRGIRMVLNADGASHACTHEEYSYGNIFEDGIKKVFKNMRKWHDDTYLFEGCKTCEYINVCGSGCRSAAFAYFKNLDAKDPLWSGYEHIHTHYRLMIPQNIKDAVDRGEKFIVPPTIRFRKESDFYSMNIRWADAISINTELAEFLMEKQQAEEPITVENMIGEDSRQELVNLIFKEALVPEDLELREQLADGVKKGASVNPNELPQAAIAAGN